MERATILVAETGADTREALVRGLAAEGFAVVEAADRPGLEAALARGPVDLVTLDPRLAHDAAALARRLRREHGVPVLLISGAAGPRDRVRGLQAAEEFVARPFHVREVALRIRRALRRRSPAPPVRTVLFDHGSFDPGRGVVRRADGRAVDLTGTEARLMELFVRHPGRCLSRDELCRALHGRDWSPLVRTIDGHVSRLRRKIAAAPDAPAPIRSVRGVGYVFVGSVRRPGGPERSP